MYDRKPPAHENPFEFLRAATPYVRQFRNRIFVIKIGGDLLAEPEARQDIAEQLSLLHHFSIKLVLVHGGGPQVDELCKKLDIPIRKIAGRRVTTPEALEVTKMVLAGSVQMNLLAEMRSAGLPVRPEVAEDAREAGHVLVVDLFRHPFVTLQARHVPSKDEDAESVVRPLAVRQEQRVDPEGRQAAQRRRLKHTRILKSHLFFLAS